MTQAACLEPTPELLTTNEVADLLRVEVTTVVRWANSGRLPQPVKFTPRVWRFRKADVLALLNGQPTR